MTMETVVRQPGPDDIDPILEIIQYYAVRDMILPRSRAEVLESLEHFLVAERAGKIVGVVSRFDYGALLKEIRSLAVADARRHSGVGTVLVSGLIDRIRADFPAAKIFVLTRAAAFFTRLGFVEVDRASLPEKIWKDCRQCAHQDNCDETALTFSAPTATMRP